MFCVFGVSIKECRKKAAKEIHSLLLSGTIEQSDYEQKVKELTQQLFETSKPKAVSAELSCPKRVKEFLDLAKKDEGLKDLKPMKKVEKLDGAGKPILTKKTKKPILQWVPMNILDI